MRAQSGAAHPQKLHLLRLYDVGYQLLLVVEACRKAGNILTRSEFDALSIGCGPVAAAMLWKKLYEPTANTFVLVVI